MTTSIVKTDKSFSVNSNLELPDAKLNKPRPQRAQGFDGWPEPQRLSLDNIPDSKKRGSKW